MGDVISHQEAKRLADQHLRSQGSSLVARHATREMGVWVVAYRDPAEPDEMLHGGGLVVTDDGDVHDVGSQPDAVDEVMDRLGRRWLHPRPPTDTDSESLALLADLDPDEAEGLAAWAASQRRERGED